MLGIITMSFMLIIILFFSQQSCWRVNLLLVLLLAVQMQTVTEQVNDGREKEIWLLLGYNHPRNVVKDQMKWGIQRGIGNKKMLRDYKILLPNKILQVTETSMLFICMYVFFQSLLISDTCHLILKQNPPHTVL